MRDTYDRIVKVLRPPARRVRNGIRWIGYGFRRSGHGFQRGGSGLRRSGRGLFGIVTQPGWGDLYASIVGTAILLGPLWVLLSIAQGLGIGAVENALCSSGQMGISIPTVITYGLEIVMAFFLLKFLFRAMVGLARAAMASPEIRDTAYSLVAALLPAVAAGLLQVGGTSLSTCLYP